MIPAIIAGIDVKRIHNGVKDILIKVKEGSFDEHLKLAKFFTSNINTNQIKNSVLMTYSDALFYFGKWYMQLWAESIGKDGKGITPIHAVGTTDQHSQLQLYLGGPKDKFFSFITTNHSKLGLKIHEETLKSHKNSSYLAGKFMGDLMQAEQQATMDTFSQNGLAFREINLPKIDEFSLGQLMTLSMLETVATCYFLGVNPFDQPAVEQCKILTKKYLS
jgi:glucose-6-phosphate isomerase